MIIELTAPPLKFCSFDKIGVVVFQVFWKSAIFQKKIKAREDFCFFSEVKMFP
jgi:hypothetical protein